MAESEVLASENKHKLGRADIQGLRSIAVGAVVINHADTSWLEGGYVGVDVFFVISGFLITGQLIRQIGYFGRPKLFSFYAARIRRLLPMSVLVLVATLIGCWSLLPPLAMTEVGRDAIATSLYASNLWFAYQGTDYLADQSPSVFQHYWSLALEEQFYLFWPVLLVIMYQFTRSRRAVAALVTILVVASFALCIFLTTYKQPWAFFTLPARAWELGIGALVAIAAARLGRLHRILAEPLGWLGLAGIFASYFLFNDETSFPGYAVAFPVLSTAAVIVAGLSRRGFGPEQLIGSPLFQWIGDRSYSIYLWHWPILVIPAMRWNLSTIQIIALVTLSILVSDLTFRYIEQPFRQSRILIQPVSRSYGFGFAATGFALAATLAATTLTGPLDAGRPTEPLYAAQLGNGLPIPSYVPSNLTPTLKGATNDLPISYSNGCHLDLAATSPSRCVFGTAGGPRVVLIGDSHAAQWFPALNQSVSSAGGSLLSLTKSACPSADVTVWNTNLGRIYRECNQWRQEALKMARDFQPDLVIISNYAASYRSDGSAQKTFPADWGDGLSRTIDSFSGSRVVVLKDTPHWDGPINVCLSGHIYDPKACAEQSRDLIDGELSDAEQSTAAASGAEYVDTTQWICSDTCQGIAGNVLIYRDEHHLTATFSTMLAPLLRSLLP